MKKDNEAQLQRAFIGLTVPPSGSLAEGKKSLPLCKKQAPITLVVGARLLVAFGLYRSKANPRVHILGVKVRYPAGLAATKCLVFVMF